MHKNVRTTVIIPAYNSGKTISRAIDSVLLQSVKDFEILIIDDASGDDTVEIVGKYAEDDARIRLYQQNTNRGAGIARSEGLKLARGKYIAFLDADDFWFDGKLEKQLAHMEAGAIICYSSYLRMTLQGNYHGISKAMPTETHLSMLRRNGIGTSSAMFRSDLIGAKEMSTIRSRQDYAFWLKLFANNKGAVVGIPDVLSCYVVGGKSVSSSPVANILNNYRMFNSVLGYSRINSLLFLACNIYFKIKTTMARYISIARMNKGHKVVDSKLLTFAKNSMLAETSFYNAQ